MDSIRIGEGVIINLAPTGMIPTKDMTPHVPVTPREIIEDALTCAAEGANYVHLHARDESGRPTYRKEIYRRIICGIRDRRPDIVIAVSCSGRTYPDYHRRAEVLDLDGDAKPDMASLTLSSLNFNRMASINSPETIKRLAAKMAERGIRPELEVFDLGMVNYAHYLIRKGLLSPPYYFNLILGNIACAQARPLHVGLLMEELPRDSVVTIGGVGDSQHRMNVMGLLFADGVRVGLEDMIYFDHERTRLATNRELVRRIVSHAGIMGRRVAEPAAVRARLGLSPR